jgi:hypothetical protein
VDRPPRPPRICIDGTGTGAAVAEMFRSALLPHPRIECWAVVITAGRAVNQAGPRSVNVAKVELAGEIRSVLESSRLKVPAELEFADALKRELGDFTVKITAASNETFEAGAGQYDDLVMCVAIPVFVSTWLDTKQVPVIAGTGPRVLPAEYRPKSRAVSFGGVWRPGSGANPYRR